MMTDPIADMLTRIRNGLQARHAKVEMPSSKLKVEIARILKEEGYVQNYKKIDDDKQGVLKVFLRWGPGGENVIEGISRVSSPGCRIYCGKDQIPKVRAGLGINILSTSRGVMTGRKAVQTGVGGEILCNVW
jgi:small subunit ribosomal protein S8